MERTLSEIYVTSGGKVGTINKHLAAYKDSETESGREREGEREYLIRQVVDFPQHIVSSCFNLLEKKERIRADGPPRCILLIYRFLKLCMYECFQPHCCERMCLWTE